MPQAVVPIIAISSVASVGLGVAANSKAKKAAKYEQKAYDAQVRQQEIQAARQRRDMIRQGRLAQATSAAASENAGVAGSSIAQGAMEGIKTSINENLSFLDQYNSLSSTASTYLGQANAYNAEANSLRGWAGTAKGVGNLAASAGKSPTFNKIFGNG